MVTGTNHRRRRHLRYTTTRTTHGSIGFDPTQTDMTAYGQIIDYGGITPGPGGGPGSGDGGYIIPGSIDAGQLANLAVGGANLVINSSFENAISGNWTAGTGWDAQNVSGDPFHGTLTAEGTPSASTLGDLETTGFIVVNRAYDYWFSAWSLLSAYTSGEAEIYVKQYNAASTLLTTTIVKRLSAAGTEWQRHSLRFGNTSDTLGRVGFEATTAKIKIGFRSVSTATFTWEIDAIQFERGNLITAYAPTPQELIDGQITETQIADNAISTPKLQANSIVAGKIAAGEIGTSHLASGTITLYGPSGEVILTPTKFGDTWWRMIHGWIANGDFRSPPPTLSSDINNSTNAVPNWTFTKASGTAINFQVVADASNGSGYALRMIMAAGAAGDSSYIQQIVPVMATQNRAFSFSPYGFIEHVARSGAGVYEAWVSIQYLKNDLVTTTGSEYTSTFVDQAPATAHETGLQSGNSAPPADAYAARVRYGLQRKAGASTSATGTVQLDETLLLASQPRVHVAEITDPANYTRATIQQSSGYLSFQPHTLGTGSFNPGIGISTNAAKSAMGQVAIVDADLSINHVDAAISLGGDVHWSRAGTNHGNSYQWWTSRAITVRAVRAGGQTLTSANTWYEINFDTADDHDDLPSYLSPMHDISSNNSRLYARVDGYYDLHCKVAWAANTTTGGTNTRRILGYAINGSGLASPAPQDERTFASAENFALHHEGTWPAVSLSTGDYVEFYVATGATAGTRSVSYCEATMTLRGTRL